VGQSAQSDRRADREHARAAGLHRLEHRGAHGRGRAGQAFIEILKAYYTGVDVGSYPIDIGREPGGGLPTRRQHFAAPTQRGTLVIRPEGLKGLRVHINAVGSYQDYAGTMEKRRRRPGR